MSDEFDRASDREEADRAEAIRQKARRWASVRAAAEIGKGMK